ncbi:hypothetical protein NDU88_004527 [Pleurodeles waltl]|uniref:Uncharacterized protein n=1 Tax=Pleurodeles waltl TaxID=8319 RepID=A0AAV7NNT6_PLEWA|nr:hypothetical protein NDU88_004527 [Pleurodeles waltl]
MHPEGDTRHVASTIKPCLGHSDASQPLSATLITPQNRRSIFISLSALRLAAANWLIMASTSWRNPTRDRAAGATKGNISELAGDGQAAKINLEQVTRRINCM